jgi:hypothetical protein
MVYVSAEGSPSSERGELSSAQNDKTANPQLDFVKILQHNDTTHHTTHNQLCGRDLFNI